MTLPILNKFEKAKILSIRSSQIYGGAPIYTNADLGELKRMQVLEIAELELKERKIPLKIRRYLPDDTFEEWSL